MTSPSANPLDIELLLENSQPRARAGWFWYALGLFLLVVLISAWAGSRSGPMAQVLNVLSGIAMFAIVVGMAVLTWVTVRRARAENHHLETVEELIQLRRWSEASAVLEHMLSSPTRTPAARVQGLIFLTMVLARYNRFNDAILVQNHLLENIMMDDGTSHALRLGRAMAMLHEDRLVDADQAINELRRTLRIGGVDDEGNLTSESIESGGLTLIELYRDVKTGHPAEAIEQFQKKLPILRQQLGHRSSDAWALAAKAYDMLGRDDDARQAYANATLLTDRSELERRYPEVESLRDKYPPSEVPSSV